jgi:voltage-gated potassium channel
MTMNRASEKTRYKFGHMLGGLLILLLVGPAIRSLLPPQASDMLVSFTIGVALAAASFSLATTAAARASAITVGVGLAACIWLGGHFDRLMLSSAAAAGFLMFCAWAITLCLRQVLTGPRVDLNRIIGAICVYMLLALAWAVGYALVALHIHGAFDGFTAVDFNSAWPELIYFSFVTLTTLGYGDISPVVPMAQALAYLEAVVGQMYIAILIAGLVGAHLSSRS